MKHLIVIGITAVCAAYLLGGCTSGQRQDTGIAAGAVVGGVAGNALTKGSVVGTVGGAVVGGVVGNEVAK